MSAPEDITATAVSISLCHKEPRGCIHPDTNSDACGDGCVILASTIKALTAERERAAIVLAPWKRRDHLSLHCGEVTAQEHCTVVAVLISCQASIRSPDSAIEGRTP